MACLMPSRELADWAKISFIAVFGSLRTFDAAGQDRQVFLETTRRGPRRKLALY